MTEGDLFKNLFNQLPPEKRLGDAPPEQKYAHMMNMLGAALDGLFNDKVRGTDRETGFVLLVFPFGDREGRCNFLSNGADRRDIVALMKEMVARFEGQPEMKGHA